MIVDKVVLVIQGYKRLVKFSKKLIYAIEALTDIAYNSGDIPVQIRDVTNRQGVPQRYLEQMMQKLVKAGILKGVRGPRGGYLLAKPRLDITIGDIARVAMEMPDEEGSALPHDVAIGPIGQAVVRPLWLEIEQRILDMMDTITLEDLTSRAFHAGITSEVHNRMTYSI